MNEIGTNVASILSSHEQINIVERQTRNAEDGLKLATQMVDARGVGDGMKLITNTLDQARRLQEQLSVAATALRNSGAAVELPHAESIERGNKNEGQ